MKVIFWKKFKDSKEFNLNKKYMKIKERVKKL